MGHVSVASRRNRAASKLVPYGCVEASRDCNQSAAILAFSARIHTDDQLWSELLSNWHDYTLKRIHIVGVTHAFGRPRHVDISIGGQLLLLFPAGVNNLTCQVLGHRHNVDGCQKVREDRNYHLRGRESRRKVRWDHDKKLAECHFLSKISSNLIESRDGFTVMNIPSDMT